MELKYFRLIKAIAEEGSIANSTEKLYLTQSALSHQLRELEERLGFKVFLRTRNNWQLTQEGAELYKMGNSVLEHIEIGLKNIQNLRAGSTGTIRLSTECYSFYQGLSSFMQRFERLYPQITIDLNLEATHQPIDKLIAHEIDVALVSSLPSHSSLSYIPIFEDEILAVMHKEHPNASAEFMDEALFSEAHLIIHSYPLDTVSVYQRFLKPHNITPHNISAIPLTEVALEMVEANMGIMCLPKWALQSFKLSDHLVFKPIGKSGLQRTHYLVFRTSDNDKHYMNDFISEIQEGFSKK